jgi:hypothetical protein
MTVISMRKVKLMAGGLENHCDLELFISPDAVGSRFLTSRGAEVSRRYGSSRRLQSCGERLVKEPQAMG